MSVFYRLHQDQSVGTKRSGKWYARMVPTSVINQLQDSKRVKLDGFGSFKIGISSKGARSAKAFTVADNIKGMHIVFSPERSTDAAGNRVKQFLQGAKCEELPENKVEKEVQGGE